MVSVLPGSVRPFIGDIEEMKHYERTDVVSGGRGDAVRAETLAEAVGGSKGFGG